MLARVTRGTAAGVREKLAPAGGRETAQNMSAAAVDEEGPGGTLPSNRSNRRNRSAPKRHLSMNFAAPPTGFFPRSKFAHEFFEWPTLSRKNTKLPIASRSRPQSVALSFRFMGAF